MDAAPADRNHPDRPVSRRGGEPVFERVMVVLLVGLSLVGMPYGLYVSAQDQARNDAVVAALADPAFVTMAGEAGFRVERTRGEGGWIGRYKVLARCVRADKGGPLPCGPFPGNPAHPGIPVEVRP